MAICRNHIKSRLARLLPGNGRVSLFALYFKGTFYSVSFFAFYYRYYFYFFTNKTKYLMGKRAGRLKPVSRGKNKTPRYRKAQA